MILSVSRRTDIPAFYSEWFFNRIKEGFVFVRNPMYYHQVSKIQLTPLKTECIVFWTKNPSRHFLENLHILDELGYKYYFQFTITSYDRSIEKNVPPKKEVIKAFKTLSKTIGKERVIWRYDPVFLNDKYDFDYHRKYFTYLAETLSPYTEKCIFSFMDFYEKMWGGAIDNKISVLSEKAMTEMSKMLLSIAKKNNLKLEGCCESNELIKNSCCIDGELINRITGKKYIFEKDTKQRKYCNCCSSIDIGIYDSCLHNCIYCYANKTSNREHIEYDVNSPLLCSRLEPEDKISIRKIESAQIEQPGLW